MNIVGLIGGGVLRGSDAFGGRDTLLLAGAPILLGVGATSATLALPLSCVARYFGAGRDG